VTAAGDRALTLARSAAIVVALGATVSPPLANLAAVLFLGAFFFVADWRARLRRMLAEPLGRGVLVFAATLVLAALLGAVGPQGWKRALADLFGWRTLLLLVLAGAVFDDGRWKAKLALAFVAIAAIGAVASIVATRIGWQHSDQAVGVVLRNTVTQAMTFAIGAFFAFLLLATRAFAARWLRRLLVLAAALLLWQLLFVATGRSGQVLLAVVAIVAAAMRLRGVSRLAAIAAVPALAVLVFALSPVVQERFKLAWDEAQQAADLSEYTSVGIRVVMWKNTAELVRERPVLGYGLAGLAPAYARHVEGRAQGWKAIVTDDPHNQYLALWAEAGLPGLLAFLFLLAAAARQPAPMPWRMVGVALLTAWCATSLVSSHFQTFNEGHLIAIFLGAFLAPEERAAADQAASAASTAAATSS